ncbi:MAG: DUF1338 domain-containing protein [Bacteroidetes bacterium]|nr:DUF1338 domain-containing protein [Bacteroidota bacterium]
MEPDHIFNKLWNDYAKLNPSVKRIKELFEQENETVLNDHIAFRTFDHPLMNLDVLSALFLKHGYQEKQDYHFKEKHLYAKHYERKDIPNAPRVFISELKLKEMSKQLQQLVNDVIKPVPPKTFASEELLFSGRVWELPSFEVYNTLRIESEYAAWLYVFGFRANHFTVSINALKTLNSVEKVNEFLKLKGYLINDSGGEIKGSPAELLEQSSIKSETIKVDFKEGIFDIPGCYYEFAKRYPDTDGKLYSGFIAKSADKIFESTDFYSKED